MARETKTIEFNFDAGLAPGTSDDLEGKHAAVATNVRWDKEGECVTRPPYRDLIHNVNINGESYTVSDGSNQVIIHDNGKYAPGGDDDSHRKRDDGLHCHVRRVVDLSGQQEMYRCDTIADGDYVYVTYDYDVGYGGPSQLDFVVVDISTGEVLAIDSVGQSAEHNYPRVAMPKVFVYKTTANELEMASINTSTWAWTVNTSLLTDKKTGSDYQVANDGTNFYIAYANTSNRATVKKFNSSGVLQATWNHATLDAQDIAILHDAANSNVYVAFADGASTSGRIVRLSDSTLTQTASNTFASTDTTHSRITLSLFDGDGAGTYEIAIFTNNTNHSTQETWAAYGDLALTTITTGVTRDGCALHSQSFNVEAADYTGGISSAGNRKHHIMALWSDYYATESNQPSLVVCNMNPEATVASDEGIIGMTPVAILAQDVADVNNGTTTTDFQANQVSSTGGKYYVACKVSTGFDTQTVSGTPEYRWGVRVYELDFSPRSFVGVAKHDEQAHTSGGFMWHPTASGFQESTVIGSPYIKSITTAAGTLSGNYSYRVVWEAADDSGKKIRSTCSPAVDKTYVSNKGVITASNPRFSFASAKDITAGDRAVYVAAIYRTKAGGSTYFLLARRQIWNDNYQMIFTDDVSDTLLEENEALRHGITGLDLGPGMVPSSKAVFSWRDRLCLISVEDDAVWYSMPKVPERGAEFNSSLRIQVPGVPVGGAQLNNNLVVFGERSIHVVSGSLADAAGKGQATSVQEISSVIGCVNAASIVRTDKGVYFQSSRGLELLGPDYKLVRVRGAEDTLRESGRTIGSAAFCPDTQDILFPTNTTSGSANCKVIRVNDTNGNVSIDEPSPNIFYNIYNLVEHGGRLWGSGATAALYAGTEVVGSSDATSKLGGDYDVTSVNVDEIVPMYTTPWFSMDGPQGEQYVEGAYLFFRMGSEDGTPRTTLQIKTFYDHSDTATTTDNVTISPSADVESPGVVKLRITPKQQRCSAIRFEFSYSVRGDSYTVMKPINLRLQVGVETGGERRTPSA